MLTVFFSYSHRDEALRNELEVHLSMLRRQGIIDTWHDRRIGAGEEIHNEISDYLEKADIILLLVSPYFLASDYCYNVEMMRALERHHCREARVIPVILHPCDWQSAPFGKLLATPTDGKPISKFPNQHEAFLEVTQAIRKVAESLKNQTKPNRSTQHDLEDPAQFPAVTHRARSSNLRIRKQFTDHEKDQFQDDAFEYLANFFEQSLMELQQRNPEVETRFKRIDANQFTTAVYINGASASRCCIRNGGKQSFGSGITYSIGESGHGGSFNELLTVEDDGYALCLKPLGMMFHHRRSEAALTQQGAAEYFWSIFIEPLQQ